MAGTRTLTTEPPRSTAYYYADLERIKKKNEEVNHPIEEDYVETTEVANDGPVAEVPPLRDRRYQERKDERKMEETYSTAGTFPMPEPKEKEPLLAELEVVGRLPLTQLDSSSGVRRSRSWYLCCPNVGEEEISRESSWRYSSLRPVTAPPIPGQNGLHLIATQSSGQDDIITLRNERDALARALAAEKQRTANEARAHDARLAELHGVIAELVRRRAQDKCARAIPEEEQEVSDECESTTQPAGELDNDADRSRTDQNDTSSLSPAELGSPRQELQDMQERQELETDSSTQELNVRSEQPQSTPPRTDQGDTSVNISERDSEICVTTARCCQFARGAHLMEGCHVPEGLLPPSPGRCESRQAKLASRVRLRRATDSDTTNQLSTDESRTLAGDTLLACDDTLTLQQEEVGGGAGVAAWRARCLRLQADCRVLDCALARALDTAHRLSCACAAQESSMVALCSALRAADRALETYDVLLALAETQPAHHTPHDTQRLQERQAAETVARRLLARLEAPPALGEPLLSPGPWLHPLHDTLDVDSEVEEVGGSNGAMGGANCSGGGGTGAWSVEQEARLRRHAARLKTDTVALRALPTPPQLFTYHTDDEDGISKSGVSMVEMEAAVMMQELLSVQEARAAERAAAIRSETTTGSCRSRRRKERERHWLDSRASETDL